MRQATWTILDVIRWADGRFRKEGIDTARLDAEVLLAATLGVDRVYLYTHFDQPLQPKELERLREAVKRRLRREPVAYIVGYKEFWSLRFKVNANVLIPRPETELLIHESLKIWSAAEKVSKPFKVLDIGTGSGAISVTLAKEITQAFITATDISETALAVARENAQGIGVGDRIQFLQGDLFTPIPNGTTFDLIVTNPPYIPCDQFPSLMPEVRDFEPRVALDGGEEGLNFYRRALPQIGRFLGPAGWFLGEIGPWQKEGLVGMVQEDSDLELIDFVKDYSGIDRVFKARKRCGLGS